MGIIREVIIFTMTIYGVVDQVTTSAKASTIGHMEYILNLNPFASRWISKIALRKYRYYG